jgi:hypothetical protein
MPAGATYEPIATTTLGSATTTVTLSSIPSTYTDLVIIVNSSVATVNNSTNMRINGDSTSTGYSYTILSGSGTTASSTRYTSVNSILINFYAVPGTSTNPDISIVNIFNYAGSTNKTILSRGNNASYGTDAIVGLWRNTAAINSITFFQPSFNFNVGSTFTIYGIKAA